MACKNVAPHAGRRRAPWWLAAASLLVVACADGAPPGSLTFGFGTEEPPPPDSVGTFAETETAGDDVLTTAADDTAGATSVQPGTEDGPSSGEPPVTCNNGALDDGEECDGPSLGDADCESQGFDAGTLACADDCTFDTSGCLTFACGNEIIEGTEVCDGAALDGETCVTQGFDSGTLGCAADCSFDTSGCIACGNGVIEGTEVCDGAALGGQTCITQGFDGGMLACEASCADFDTGSCTTDVPPLPACTDQDLLSAVGSPVANGTTVGQNEAMRQNCGGSGGVDFVLRFIAPAAATYQFTTEGSAYDTVLSLHDTCGAAPVQCNDDSIGLQSSVSLAMAAGQQILIAVSGYSGGTGNWTLNIIQM